MDAFVLDESTGIAAAAEHLATLGRRDIALLTGPGTQPTLYTTRTRRALYTQELDRRGLKLRPELVVPITPQAAKWASPNCFATDGIDAPIASSDAMAVGADGRCVVAGPMVPPACGPRSISASTTFSRLTYTDPQLR